VRDPLVSHDNTWRMPSPIFSLSAHGTMLFVLGEASIYVGNHLSLYWWHLRDVPHQQILGGWSRAHINSIKCFVLYRSLAESGGGGIL
jgi:hypothetical protein